MFQIRNKKIHTARGFSLIELLVAVALFVVVMTVSVGTLLALVDANSKAQSLKSVINNLNFALDSMTRTLRTGYRYHCNSAANVAALPTTRRDCASGDTGISVVDDRGQRVGYRLLNETVQRRVIGIDGDSGWVPLTSPDVRINEMLFYVTNTSLSDDTQPLVTIGIRGEAGQQTKIESSFNIQTTVTQRVLDQ